MTATDREISKLANRRREAAAGKRSALKRQNELSEQLDRVNNEIADLNTQLNNINAVEEKLRQERKERIEGRIYQAYEDWMADCYQVGVSKPNTLYLGRQELHDLEASIKPWESIFDASMQREYNVYRGMRVVATTNDHYLQVAWHKNHVNLI